MGVEPWKGKEEIIYYFFFFEKNNSPKTKNIKLVNTFKKGKTGALHIISD